MSNLQNILNDGDELNEEDLLKYLNGNLSSEEKNAVEQKMANSSFADDALEGLQQFKSKKDINTYVAELNEQLHKQTSAPKKRRIKRRLKNMQGIEITVVIVILLCLLGYFVVKNYLQHRQPSKPSTEQKQ